MKPTMSGEGQVSGLTGHGTEMDLRGAGRGGRKGEVLFERFEAHSHAE